MFLKVATYNIKLFEGLDKNLRLYLFYIQHLSVLIQSTVPIIYDL